MDAGGGTGSVPTDLIQIFGGIGGTAALVFLLWATILKDPPILVPYRQVKDLIERLDKQEAKTERYLGLVLKINDQANKSTHVAEEALNVAKNKTTQGRVGSKGQRQTDANETD